ncbi:MAG: hypothetical protein U0869_11385 [Chloroflexota bacterium]
MLALLVPVLLLELGMRGLVWSGRLPEAPAHERTLETSWADLHAAPPPDVLLAGDSIIERSLDPAILAEGLTTAAGRPVRAFNLGQAGASPAQTALLVDALIAEGRLPPVVILGVTPDLLAGQLADGDAAALGSPFAQGLAGCGGRTDPVAIVDCLLGQVSVAWRWHGRPGRVAEALGGPAVPLPVTSLGRRADGFLTGSGTTDAALAAELERRARGRRVVEGATDEVIAVYRDLVGRIEAAGSRAVIVAFPYSPPFDDAIEARRPGSMAARDAGLDRLAAATGVDVLRIPRFGDWWSAADAYDLRHLSTAGAAVLTRELLARDDVRAALLAALPDGGSGGR